MTVPPTYRTSSANGWLEVFGSASKRPVEPTPVKEIARQLKSVTQALPAGQSKGSTVGNIHADEARRSREARISHAIDSIPIDMAPGLRPLFSAFLIIGVGNDDAVQYSLDTIDRAVAHMKGGYIDAARDILKQGLSQLTPGNQATPPANPLTAPGRPVRPPGA